MANAGRVAIVPQDDFESSKSYKRLDMVKYSGGLYVAKKETAGNLPTDTEFWMKMGEFSAQIMTSDNNGVGRPDGVTIEVDENGVLSVIGGGSGNVSFTKVTSIPTPDVAEDGKIYLMKIDGATGANKYAWYTLMEDTGRVECINDYGMDFADYVDKESYNLAMGSATLKTANKTIKSAINELFDEIESLLGVVGEDTLETTAQTLTGAVNELHGGLDALSFLSVVDGALCVKYNG